jgi:hypothetical protein
MRYAITWVTEPWTLVMAGLHHVLGRLAYGFRQFTTWFRVIIWVCQAGAHRIQIKSLPGACLSLTFTVTSLLMS